MLMDKEVYLFSLFLFIPLIFYRLVVFFRDGKVSVLREVTGLNVHHYHYGVLWVTIGVLLLLFYEISTLTVCLTALGLGTILDSFISSLFNSTTRAGEIVNYQGALVPTVVLFIGVLGFVTMLYKMKN